MKNKYFIFLGLGVINIVHALLHFFQFIQSLLWVSSSHNEKLDTILHSPIFSVVWLIIGIISLWVGVRDFHHHKKCK